MMPKPPLEAEEEEEEEEEAPSPTPQPCGLRSGTRKEVMKGNDSKSAATPFTGSAALADCMSSTAAASRI